MQSPSEAPLTDYEELVLQISEFRKTAFGEEQVALLTFQTGTEPAVTLVRAINRLLNNSVAASDVANLLAAAADYAQQELLPTLLASHTAAVAPTPPGPTVDDGDVALPGGGDYSPTTPDPYHILRGATSVVPKKPGAAPPAAAATAAAPTATEIVAARRQARQRVKEAVANGTLPPPSQRPRPEAPVNLTEDLEANVSSVRKMPWMAAGTRRAGKAVTATGNPLRRVT